MSESIFEIDITLPLKKWEKCDLSYDKVSEFCREKSIELRTEAKKCDQSSLKEPLVPQADMYDLCIIMLNLARTNGAEFVSMTHVKKRVVFKFNFDCEGSLDLFHEDFITWLKRAKLVDPGVEVDQPKTFSCSNKKKNFANTKKKKAFVS